MHNSVVKSADSLTPEFIKFWEDAYNLESPTNYKEGVDIYGPGVMDCKGGLVAAAVTVAGIPCVDAIGVAGDFIHTPNEYATLSSLPEAANRFAAVCIYI